MMDKEMNSSDCSEFHHKVRLQLWERWKVALTPSVKLWYEMKNHATAVVKTQEKRGSIIAKGSIIQPQQHSICHRTISRRLPRRPRLIYVHLRVS